MFPTTVRNHNDFTSAQIFTLISSRNHQSFKEARRKQQPRVSFDMNSIELTKDSLRDRLSKSARGDSLPLLNKFEGFCFNQNIIHGIDAFEEGKLTISCAKRSLRQDRFQT